MFSERGNNDFISRKGNFIKFVWHNLQLPGKGKKQSQDSIVTVESI